MTRPAEEITQLLFASRGGDAVAMEELLDLVYADLRSLASRQLRGEPGEHTLSATALVHEAYLRLMSATEGEFNDRQHFFRLIARAMRRISIDRARQRLAQKRGAGQHPGSLDEEHIPDDARASMLLELEDVLEKLRAEDERLVQIVECRFYAGLTEKETAEALDCSRRTVQREWERAKQRLKELLAE
ncbi:MAG: ECF-type sigma factor [Xanthomonadales bacterium]|nr:ECF-type sigma factor [Xanthomonadales bacterium]